MTSKKFKQTSLLFAINMVALASTNVNADDIDTVETVDSLPTTILPTIIVVAGPESANGPVDGIAASTVSSSTGFEESILKSTQSISVVGEQEIEAIGATTLNDALSYTAGVSQDVATDRTTEVFNIRGFYNNVTYRDGQKYQANRYDGRQEVYGLERIEVVKGAASVINGITAPGGIINVVSKKPFFSNAYEVKAQLGSFDHHQVATDINQVINDDVAVRLVGVYQDSDAFTDYVADDRKYIAPSLTWQPTDATKLTLKADYQKDLTSFVYGLPAEGTVYDTPNGKIDRSFYPGIVGYDKYDNERYNLGYDLTHQVNPNLKVKHNLQYMETDLSFPYSSVGALVSGSQTEYQRNFYPRNDTSSQLTSGLSAVYEWDYNDDVKNVTLFGVDYAKQEHTTQRNRAPASSLDFFNPDRSQESVGANLLPNGYEGESSSDQKDIYVQNQTTVDDKWIGVLGVRHSRVSGKETEILFTRTVKEGDYNTTTGRVGLVYLMDNGVAPYASINQSSETTFGLDRNGNTFDPTEGTQYEVGVRYQPEGLDTLLTGSVYRIDQTGVLVEDPEDRQFQTQLGEVRSQGVELEAKTQLGDNANLIASYAYTDARTIKSSPVTPQLEGNRTANVPYNTFSLWGDYRFSDYNLPNLSIGAGVRYMDSSLDRDNEVEAPSYTLVDAMLNYKVNDNWALALNFKNLLDEEYVTCVYGCYYGEPRNVVGKVTYKW